MAGGQYCEFYDGEECAGAGFGGEFGGSGVGDLFELGGWCW